MTPWHLIPKHERELVLRELERDLSCVDCPDAYRAAAALLREAAPASDVPRDRPTSTGAAWGTR